ncbi:MAG TPA: hypothetical protein VIA10_14615 [Gaiellaceae bacterium]|jgi:hypothetical protein
MNETAAGGSAALFVLALYALHFGSIVWIGLDARKRDFSSSRFASKTWQWVVGAIFLWIIVFPVYLFKRGTAPLKNA